MHPHYVFVWTHFLVVWNIHALCNLPCAMSEIATHGIVTRVTATQVTCLGKYLTMPYHKNATKKLSS